MLQLAMLLIGLAGIIGLYQIYVQKKQFLSPFWVKKFGEQNSRVVGTSLAIILIAVGILGLFLPQVLGVIS